MIWASQVVLVVKHLQASARDVKDKVLVPGLGRSLGGGHDNHSNILACRIPWTEEPSGLQFIWSQRVRHD